MESPLTKAIQEAIASGDFIRATLLWDEYVAAIRHEIARGTCTEDRFTEAGGLVKWSREVMLYQRARAQAELGRMWVSSRYGSPEDVGRPMLAEAAF